MSTPKSYTIYFAGELFSAKHLAGNAAVAQAIYKLSKGKYLPSLPQDLELRSTAAQDIRDTDIHSLLECDLAIFNFDGPELDSGTVVEFMFAKMADIPCVILRSDFRSAGDQPGGDPWNLMASFYPRSVSVAINSMSLYKEAIGDISDLPLEARLARSSSTLAANYMNEGIAAALIKGLDQVVELAPALPKHLRASVYEWLALMPGFKGDKEQLKIHLQSVLQGKIGKNLL